MYFFGLDGAIDSVEITAPAPVALASALMVFLPPVAINTAAAEADKQHTVIIQIHMMNNFGPRVQRGSSFFLESPTASSKAVWEY